MGAAVSITRLDLTASELRRAASGEKDSSAARRILALALVLDGVDRKTAAETCGMDRQTLRDWVHRYTAAGLAGLRNLKSPGILDQNSRHGSEPNWPSLSRPVPTPWCTVSCAGGGSICATNCSGASGHVDPHLGQAWNEAPCTARPTLRLAYLFGAACPQP